jgi:hypothetical protein
MKRTKPEAWCCECGDHWWAKLTKGFVAMVSPQDAALLQNYVWSAARRSSGRVYAQRSGPNARPILLHRDMMPVALVDHVDRNGLDNRRENIRNAGRTGNSANRVKTKKPRSSLKKGVHLRSGLSNPWRVFCGGKHVGYFATEEDAAQAYDQAAKNLYGEFARTNA